MTLEEKTYIDDLIINALTVNTDEVEGLQTIDLNSLNLCAVDYQNTDDVLDVSVTDQEILALLYQDTDLWKLITTPAEELPEVIKDISLNDRTIIEFSEATTKDPNPVRYTISVKPGEVVNDNTIFGKVEQEGVMKDIHSIFQRATVKGNEDNSEFFRLYPSKCNRHIVLEDALLTDGNEFDLHEDIQDICDQFTDEAMLYALIVNNLAPSLLPYVLSHRYRGTYTRKSWAWEGLTSYGSWYLGSNDTEYDNLDISTFVEAEGFEGGRRYDTSLYIYDTVNENLGNGLQIWDASIMQVLNDIQDDFGSKMICSDIDKDQMSSWRRRARKKKNRKKVKNEINNKVETNVDKIKKSKSPYQAIRDEGDRLISERQKYIDRVIELYQNKENLPLCKYDPDYTDCQFLTNDEINGDVLDNAKSYDDDFSYYGVGDSDNYYNYYTSLLANINLLGDNKYVNEFYDLVTDIINKRLIIENRDYLSLMKQFMNLFNSNIKTIFSYKDNKESIISAFNKFEGLVNTYANNAEKERQTTLKQEFSNLDDVDSAVLNAGTLYTADNQYQKIYDYINSLYSDDEDDSYSVVSQLATLYTYIKSYGTGETNQYKDVETEGKYIYFALVLEEALKITDFWDKIIKLYLEQDLNKCILNLKDFGHQFDSYASWPSPSDIRIGDVNYHHYLFENIYPKNDATGDPDIEIGDYDFPESVTPPDIPDSIDVDENDALADLLSHEQQPMDDPNAISFLDFKYWQKYFALATLICLVPIFWNCGLDIIPFIQMIPLPCIFICISSFYIPIFNMLIVVGIAIRGMYPFPIILYLNTSDQPISVLTPLIAILDQLKDVFFDKLNNIEMMPIQTLVNLYIKKLSNEINDIKKENIKLTNFETVCKNMKFPNAESIQRQFASIVDPSIDFRQKCTRISQLAKKSRV